jgi:YhhN family
MNVLATQSVQPVQMAILLTLFALWAVLLFGGFALGPTASDRTRRMPTWTRMGSSLTLVAIAWLWYAFTRQSPVGNYALLIAVGMSCGCLGDLFLASVIPLSEPVLGGMLAFGLGHVSYLVAAIAVGNQFRFGAPLPRFGMLAVWLLIGLTGWYIVIFRGQKPGTLHWAALPYALLLASVAGLFSGLALQSGTFVPAALGAALFLVSDLILANQLFNGRTFPFVGDIIWLTYGPGQALLVASVAGALQVAHRPPV